MHCLVVDTMHCILVDTKAINIFSYHLNVGPGHGTGAEQRNNITKLSDIYLFEDDNGQLCVYDVSGLNGAGAGVEGKSVSDSGRSGFLFCSLVSLLTEI